MIPTTYCNGKHTVKVELRDTPHPALTMSKARAVAWEKEATDEQFYEQLQHLASIYAKRHYVPGKMLDETALFVDYKKWRDDVKMRTSPSAASSRKG